MKNRIEIRGGPTPETVGIRLNGEPVHGCARLEFVADPADPEGVFAVKIHLLAEVDIDVEGEVSQGAEGAPA